MSVYGFWWWWWWDLNRQLRRLGERTQSWRALAAVTVGWVTVVAPFRSVRETTAAIAAAQRHTGVASTARPRTAVTLAIIAAVGLGLFPLTSIVFPAWVLADFAIGLVPIIFGMALVAYVQREFNRAIQGLVGGRFRRRVEP